MQYNTNQWIIYRYPVAAGGKFLTSCFFQFDQVAHWSKQQLSTNDTIAWYKNSLPEDTNAAWAIKEIDTPWVIPVSRSFPRGELLTEDEFNEQLHDTENNEYFNQVWQQKKYILDFWHKYEKPIWWTNANWITIVIDDMDLYKKLIFSKVFEYDPIKKTVIFHDQRPDLGRPIEQQMKKNFCNPWFWKNVPDKESFFNEVVIKFPWYQSWDFNAVPDANYILLSDLFNTDRVYKFLLEYEELFQQKVDYDYVRQLHNIWTESTIKRFT
jgi:hypothetical protein